jgi:CheY-like chemotaxis protein
MDKILVIQDSPSINLLLTHRLKKGDFAVEIAETGEEGLQKAQQGQFQFILLDYHLPGMDGLAVCKALKKEPSTKNIPIAFISANQDPKLVKETKTAGAATWLDLSVATEELWAKISQIIKTNKLK